MPYCRLLIPQNSTIMFNCSKSFISSKLNWKEVLQQLQEAEIFLNKSQELCLGLLHPLTHFNLFILNQPNRD